MVDECIDESRVGRFGVRHFQVILQFFFYIILDGIKMSLAGTIPAMLVFPDGYSNWTSKDIAWVLSSYLLGFLVTGLFGGWICKKFGYHWPMVIGMFIISEVTINLPNTTQTYGYQGLMACRIVQGLCSGIVFPMPADFISRWVPVQERTVLGTTIYASGTLGTVLGLFLSTYLSTTSLGWTFIYTLYGYLALAWAIVMAFCGADSPEAYTGKISDLELNYILQNRGGARPKAEVKIPWRQILTSMPFWAIIVAQIGASWLFNVGAVNVVVFLYNFYGASPSSFQGVNFIVLIISWIFTFIFSAVAQLYIRERRTTIEQSRKIFNTIGCLIPALILILFMVLPAWNKYQGVALYTLLSIASVATIVGSTLNVNDISSNFAPIIYGTANWIGIALVLIFTIIFNVTTLGYWLPIFLFSVILLVVTNAFFLKFGSGEEQVWELYEEVEDEESQLSKSTSRASNDEGKYLLFVKKQ